jgi:hypothetical protein
MSKTLPSSQDILVLLREISLLTKETFSASGTLLLLCVYVLLSQPQGSQDFYAQLMALHENPRENTGRPERKNRERSFQECSERRDHFLHNLLEGDKSNIFLFGQKKNYQSSIIFVQKKIGSS